jgi:four helix bundle protein
MHHEDTELYKQMLLLVGDCAKAVTRIPRGDAKLADQIKRASRAVPALFSEGARRRSPTDRAHYFDQSAGSARECSSHVDVAHVSMLMSAEDRLKIKARCDRICAMLYKFR